MRAIVVGGGIGGAATALALSVEGVDVVLVEQAPALTEVGAGLQINANGTRALRHLGVLDRFHKVAVEAQSYRIMQLETGEIVHEHQLGEQARAIHGERSYEAHRADLLDCLVGGLPPGVVRTGARCVSVRQSGTAATVTLDTGATLDADLVIGADGIHSAVRDSVFGPVQAIPTGTSAWRALIPAAEIADLDLTHRFYGWRGPGRIAVGYWARAEELFNFAVFVPEGELIRESWSQRGDHTDLMRATVGAEPLLRSLVERARDNFISSLNYYRPMPTWVDGRVALVGDAAHAVLPYMHQGANQALEDAVVLGRLVGESVASGGDPTAALVAYERLRRPRTSKIQSDVLALAEFWFADDPVQRRAGAQRMRAQDRDDPAADSQWGYVYSYDPVLEADQRATRFPPAMSVSRATREAVWPSRPAATQRWADIFDFASLAGGHLALRRRYDEHFGCDVVARAVELGGVRGAIVGASDAEGPTIMHVHGGGYVLGSAAAALGYAAKLADAAGGTVIALDNRRAPEAPWPAPVDDLLDAYAAQLRAGTDPGRIVFSGESSGAAIVVSALVRLRDSGRPLPAGVVGVSPFADLTLSGESMAVNGFVDDFLSRDRLRYLSTSYTQGADPTSGAVSPVFADLAGLPPVLLVAGRDEAVAGDAVRIVQGIEHAGGTARLVLAPTATHAFAIFADEPAADAAIALLGAAAARMSAGPEQFGAFDSTMAGLARRITEGDHA